MRGEEMPHALEGMIRSLNSEVLNAGQPAAWRTTNEDDGRVFEGECAPAISIGKFLKHLWTYSRCSPITFICAYALISRLARAQHPVRLSSLNAHRVLLSALTVAEKLMDDSCSGNAYWANLGGIRISELNAAEIELMMRLDFRVHVPSEKLKEYTRELEERAGGGLAVTTFKFCGKSAYASKPIAVDGREKRVFMRGSLSEFCGNQSAWCWLDYDDEGGNAEKDYSTTPMSESDSDHGSSDVDVSPRCGQFVYKGTGVNV